MRISDWSSDVCSSDLRSSDAVISSSQARPLQCSCLRCPVLIEGDTDRRHMTLSVHNVCRYSGPSAAVVPRQGHREGVAQTTIEAVRPTHPEGRVAQRSEETTSELQSLIRNSSS